MTIRRGGRPSQVRPRPPSTGRPAPTKPRPRAPATGRVGSHRKIERSRGLPVLARIVLVVAVVGLGGLVLYTASGGLTRAWTVLATSLDGVIDRLTVTASPSPSLGLIGDAPILEAPAEPYTNQKLVDLVVNVPANAVGVEGARVRLYVALPDQAAVDIADAPIGSTRRIVLPSVELTKGVNDFSATIVGPDGAESDQSPIVRYVLDTAKPRIILSSPKDGATINRPTVKLTGRTQGRSTLVARNSSNAASITGSAAANGTFSLSLPIVAGSNPITITATDPAGNVGELVLAVKRGSGKLTASIGASIYRIGVSRLPEPLQLTVLVTDPDGSPLEGARVTFSVSIPGIAPLTFDTQTGGDGRATFRTTVPRGASPGTGPASVLVRTEEYGRTTDRTVITIVK